MQKSYMLAQIIGIFLSILGLGFILNRDHIQKVFSAVVKNHALQLVATILPLIFGSYLVVIHNHWVANWSIIITLIAWIILIVGAFRAIFPEFWIERVKKFQEKGSIFTSGIVFLVLGLILMFFGFKH